MPPQIINYDPNSGIAAIQKSGEQISKLLGESKQAELSLMEGQRKQKAIQYLNDVIQARTQKGGAQVGAFPMFDPVIREAAMAVAPVAHDYVNLLLSLHEKNVSAAEPKSVAGGYTQLDPTTGETKFTDTTPPEARTVNPTLGMSWFVRGGVPQFGVPQQGDLPYNRPRSGGGSEPSANLKTLIQKKNALQATITQKYPHINLDEVIRQGHGPIRLSTTFENLVKSGKITEEEAYQFDKNAKPDPMFQDWLKAINSFEARAKVEDYPFDPAKSLIPSKSPVTPAPASAPAASPTPPSGSMIEPAVNPVQKMTKDALIQDFVKEEGREPTADELEKLRLAGVWQ